jgi:hypothetical protein
VGHLAARGDLILALLWNRGFLQRLLKTYKSQSESFVFRRIVSSYQGNGFFQPHGTPERPQDNEKIASLLKNQNQQKVCERYLDYL